jgi:hypothetical protein
MGTEGKKFNIGNDIPRLKAPSPLERLWLTTKSLLFLANDEEKRRLDS